MLFLFFSFKTYWSDEPPTFLVSWWQGSSPSPSLLNREVTSQTLSRSLQDLSLPGCAWQLQLKTRIYLSFSSEKPSSVKHILLDSFLHSWLDQKFSNKILNLTLPQDNPQNLFSLTVKTRIFSIMPSGRTSYELQGSHGSILCPTPLNSLGLVFTHILW